LCLDLDPLELMTTPQETTRTRLRRYLIQRFYTRFHMTLILASSSLAAMLASWGMLKLGATSMLARYPVAVVVSYAVFLASVWLWLRYVEAGARSNSAASSQLRGDGFNLPNLGGGGGGSLSGSGGGIRGGGGGTASGGGDFGGGGAGGSWLEATSSSGGTPDLPTNALGAIAQQRSAEPAASGMGKLFSGSGGGSGFDLDGDGLLLLILAGALIGTIFVASGYLLWAAPDILSEALFGATLAGGLAHRAKREDAGGWVAGIVKKTWWPFALVLVLAVAFAGFSGKHYPTAHTFRQAVAQALGN
jgi:hypothetical protein